MVAKTPQCSVDNRRIATRLQLTMKPLSMSLALLGGLMSLRGEEIAAPQWEVEIPGPIADGTPPEPAPKPEPIEFK